jgi:hypothetical protein
MALIQTGFRIPNQNSSFSLMLLQKGTSGLYSYFWTKEPTRPSEFHLYGVSENGHFPKPSHTRPSSKCFFVTRQTHSAWSIGLKCRC